VTSEALTCRELVELVSDYLEDRMPLDERVVFEEHLHVCPGCTNYLAQMRETIRTVGRLREEDISPEARDELLQAFRAWTRK
jgi:predicted anti-sigma-YlaC factor YlaD